MKVFRVQPGYGWGWFDSSGTPTDVPDAFILEAEPLAGEGDAWVGLAPSDGGHPLNGLWVVLTPRHSPPDGDMNLTAFAERPLDILTLQPGKAEAIISGFASISPGVD